MDKSFTIHTMFFFTSRHPQSTAMYALFSTRCVDNKSLILGGFKRFSTMETIPNNNKDLKE